MQVLTYAHDLDRTVLDRQRTGRGSDNGAGVLPGMPGVPHARAPPSGTKFFGSVSRVYGRALGRRYAGAGSR